MRAITLGEPPTRDLHGVDVWLDDHSTLSPDDRAPTYALLDCGERDRHDTLLRDEDRVAYLVAHRLRRETLSHYCDVEPSAWRFQTDARGRPFVVMPDPVPLSFSLSHTRGLSMCAVARAELVGVDVEDESRELDVDAVGAVAMTPTERQRIHALGPAEFFRAWTLKEAYTKARGLGLALPFDRIGFASGTEIHLECDLEIEPRPTSWRFASFAPRVGYRAAVAVCGVATGVVNLVWRDERCRAAGPRTAR